MIRFSTFQNCKNPAATMVEVADWSEFVAHLADLPHVHADKAAKINSSPAISPAIYASGATRQDQNVLGWSSWMGIDIDNDLLVTPISDAEEVMQTLQLNYLLYTTTKASTRKPRYRILFPISRDLAVDEIKPAWTAMAHYFGALGPDPRCKDLSRLYMAPALWLPGRPGQVEANLEPYNEFLFSLDGKALDIDEVMASWTPPPSEEAAPVPTVSAPVVHVPAADRKPLARSYGLHDSPVVKSDYVQAYLSLGKGDHHTGMFKFLCSVLGRAKIRGFDVTDAELTHYARELDAISPVKTASDRWARFPYEISRARAFTQR